MANEEQLAILKKGNQAWNEWRMENPAIAIDLNLAQMNEADLSGYDLSQSDLKGAHLWKSNLRAYLRGADLRGAFLDGANLRDADLSDAKFGGVLVVYSDQYKDYKYTDLRGADLSGAITAGTNFSKAIVGGTMFANIDLSEAIGLEKIIHSRPSSISTDTIALSKGRIDEAFLRGCGLSDWEIEATKLYRPDVGNEEINKILYHVYDLRASQAIQISPLFISYSHGDGAFVDKLERCLNKKGIRFWRDIHDAKAGRLEKQIDRAIRQNPTVLLILSEHSLQSDWVEHEVHMARTLEKQLERDVLCPIALDDSWKDSPWSKIIMEQVTKYNILDFSVWEDDSKFESQFNKLIDGLELFYK